MQLLTSKCPYCGNQVETAIENIDGPVVCTSCAKPFAMQMPTATVTAVREVSQTSVDDRNLASKPNEQTLLTIHPVVFRARPLRSLILLLICVAAVGGLVISLAADTPILESQLPAVDLKDTELAGHQISGPTGLLTWLSAATLIVAVLIIGYWQLLSSFTTLTVTDRRSILQEGIVRRETSEVQHDDVRNLRLDQTFMQRMMNIGSVGISSSGQDGLEVIVNGISNPSRLISIIREKQV